MLEYAFGYSNLRRWRGGFISRANVADFLIKQIASDKYLRQAPVLIG